MPSLSRAIVLSFSQISIYHTLLKVSALPPNARLWALDSQMLPGSQWLLICPQNPTSIQGVRNPEPRRIPPFGIACASLRASVRSAAMPEKTFEALKAMYTHRNMKRMLLGDTHCCCVHAATHEQYHSCEYIWNHAMRSRQQRQADTSSSSKLKTVHALTANNCYKPFTVLT